LRRVASATIISYVENKGEIMQTETVMMPRELTAENGGKAALMGEFFERISEPCFGCVGDDPSGCEICNGWGELHRDIPVSWSTIKAIYARAVSIFAT
jgi:hypothetical protein